MDARSVIQSKSGRIGGTITQAELRQMYKEQQKQFEQQKIQKDIFLAKQKIEKRAMEEKEFQENCTFKPSIRK